MGDKEIKQRVESGSVDAFLEQVKKTPVKRASGSEGRLIFALDATASRQFTWDMACQLQGQMFDAAADVGNLAVQLCYYRGFNECKASRWLEDTTQLHRAMSKVHCLGGHTQIERVLKHVLAEQKSKPVNALAFVGDCMEENVDRLCQLSGQLGLLGVPVFVFQEGQDFVATHAFKQIARLSGGAHCSFDQSSARLLSELLRAVAVFAAGGRKALQDYSEQRPALAHLTDQIK